MKKLFLAVLFFLCMPAHAEDFLWYHDGGSEIDDASLQYTISKVIDTLPSRHIDGIKNLVHETFIVETRCGGASYDKAAQNWNNYGIAQIRSDTASWLMNVLYKRDRSRFSEIYKYYDPEMSIEQNLLTNVPFSIAICAELYAWRLKGQSINTVTQRAYAWKRYYNTVHGVGSVKGYLKRVQTYLS